ncbi:CPBP family glutamic-type intramembrane protease [Novosphingobium sp.]|uniref:CPBP family glutamic-type intramembrane protease n=1 Tax=Novosphingobium sp. TaxID=1874826 RepID=UPI0025F9634A|nr:CPBP family glutamic-type intramembrane protease [Novosphingobium sp.]
MNDDVSGFAPIGGAGPVPFVALTFAISWVIWLGGWLMAGRPGSLANPGMSAAAYLGSFGPGIAAAVLSRRAGRLAAGQWAQGFLRWNIGWRATAVVALVLPLMVEVLTLALGFTPRMPAGQAANPVPAFAALFPVSVLLGMIAGLLGRGPLGEEGGWRGYLLPRLLARSDALKSSALLGVIWIVWQLPILLLFTDARDGQTLAGYLSIGTLRALALSYIATTVWRRSRGSLVACIWLQGMVLALAPMAFVPTGWTSSWNVASGFVPFTLALCLVAAGLALIQKRRSGAY